MVGYQELLVIFLIVLLLFGGRKIPEVARGLGKGLREFRKAKDDIRDAIEQEATVADHSQPEPDTDMASTAPPDDDSVEEPPADPDTAGARQT